MPDDHDCTHDETSHDCAFDAGRRSFLKDGLLAVAALTALSGGAAELHAMARSYARGVVKGDTITYAIPTADGATIDDANKVILVRYQGAIAAFSVECPHRGTPLEWQPDQSRFFCPKHKSTFQPEGTLIQGKAERNMDRFAVKLDGDKVVVETGTKIQSNLAMDQWTAAVVKVPATKSTK